MNDGDVERVMKLAFCTEEEARQALAKTNDVIDAVDLLLVVPPTLGAPKQKIMTEEQQHFKQIRVDMEEIDRSNEIVLKKSGQSDSSSQGSSHTHDLSQEEMSLHSESIQNSHLPTLEEEEQTQETACQ
jgi:NACalpha-BTF3-like transcription factor